MKRTVDEFACFSENSDFVLWRWQSWKSPGPCLYVKENTGGQLAV